MEQKLDIRLMQMFINVIVCAKQVWDALIAEARFGEFCLLFQLLLQVLGVFVCITHLHNHRHGGILCGKSNMCCCVYH